MGGPIVAHLFNRERKLFMKVVKAIDNGLTKVEEFLAMILMIGMILTVTLQIVNQAFLHLDGFAWTEEFSRVLLIWTLMIGSCIVTKRGRHLVVTFVYDGLKGPVKMIVRILVLLISIFVCCYVCRSGIYMVKSQNAGNQTFAMIGLPMSYASISVPICFGIMALRFVLIGIEEVYNAIVAKKGGDK